VGKSEFAGCEVDITLPSYFICVVKQLDD